MKGEKPSSKENSQKEVKKQPKKKIAKKVEIKDYVCIDKFSVGTNNPKTFEKDKTYKFREDIGRYYVRQGKLKNK